jgi:ubiquinone/menaquinone biosynthesis C-methylase UbiE
MAYSGDEKIFSGKTIEFVSRSNSNGFTPSFYDNYEYDSFWIGRNFENLADQMAVKRLIEKNDMPHGKIVDIGAGTGRMSFLYEEKWKELTLIDLSSIQLSTAKKRAKYPDKTYFIQGVAEAIPLRENYCDTVICIRMFHYVNNPRLVISEIARVLSPGGHLILEIPNKIHIKSRIKALFYRNLRRELLSPEPKSIALKDKSVIFVNHHPETIKKTLLSEGFEILDSLSVSNFRSAFFKKFIPLRVLLAMEKLIQRPLVGIWFGPSIYFLARKSKEVVQK